MMNLTRSIALTLATTISMFLFAGLLHNVMFADFYVARSGGVHEANFVAPLGYLVLGTLMVLIFRPVHEGKKLIVEGLIFGATIGLLWVFPHDLVTAGIHGDPLDYVFINAMVHIAEQGLGGGVLGFIFGRFQKKDRVST